MPKTTVSPKIVADALRDVGSGLENLRLAEEAATPEERLAIVRTARDQLCWAVPFLADL